MLVVVRHGVVRADSALLLIKVDLVLVMEMLDVVLVKELDPVLSGVVVDRGKNCWQRWCREIYLFWLQKTQINRKNRGLGLE